MQEKSVGVRAINCPYDRVDAPPDAARGITSEAQREPFLKVCIVKHIVQKEVSGNPPSRMFESVSQMRFWAILVRFYYTICMTQKVDCSNLFLFMFVKIILTNGIKYLYLKFIGFQRHSVTKLHYSQTYVTCFGTKDRQTHCTFLQCKSQANAQFHNFSSSSKCD